ncbi:MAG: DUF2236 domain-containing protein [Flavobacteriales bacterium]|nr:DUF2236 domain-containing protein [Flavobacteriales bacterium]MCB9448513.1 DUF2236 domain-containing protein [Flavobacteriales bacterium]
MNTWSDTFLDQKRQVQDPPADNVIQQIVNDHGIEESRKIFDVLIRNVDLPAEQLPSSISDYLRNTSILPAWADPKKIELAQSYFLDQGPKLLLILFYKSLPLLYACKNGAQVLIQTGRLAHADDQNLKFARRIAETGQFLLHVMIPGTLKPGGEAIPAIQKIRLIHAAIRHFVQIKEWDHATLGRPINQEDMALTILTFGIALVDGLEKTGIQEPEEKKEAYLHTWNVIGYVLGLNEDLMAHNLSEARTLMEQILQRQAAESEAGRVLTQALISFSTAHIPDGKLEAAPDILIRFMCGNDIADKLGLQTKNGCLGIVLPAFLSFLARKGEQLEDKYPQLDGLFDQLSLKMLTALVGYFDTYKGKPFTLPEVFRKQWKV